MDGSVALICSIRPDSFRRAVPLDFLAIGDSWFEYPLYNEVLSFQNNAIVAIALYQKFFEVAQLTEPGSVVHFSIAAPPLGLSVAKQEIKRIAAIKGSSALAYNRRDFTYWCETGSLAMPTACGSIASREVGGRHLPRNR